MFITKSIFDFIKFISYIMFELVHIWLVNEVDFSMEAERDKRVMNVVMFFALIISIIVGVL